jgi:hypothetical protein
VTNFVFTPKELLMIVESVDTIIFNMFIWLGIIMTTNVNIGRSRILGEAVGEKEDLLV